MAFVQIVNAKGVTAEQYDKVIELAYGGKLHEGELFHVAGPTADGFCVIDAWESREQCDASMEKLMPALEASKISLTEMPVEFEVHRLEVR
jgi:hypothetical protein